MSNECTSLMATPCQILSIKMCCLYCKKECEERCNPREYPNLMKEIGCNKITEEMLSEQ